MYYEHITTDIDTAREIAAAVRNPAQSVHAEAINGLGYSAVRYICEADQQPELDARIEKLDNYRNCKVFTVILTTRWGFGAETYENEFDTEKEARSFCREEVKWESTGTVKCVELDIDWTGDFA